MHLYSTLGWLLAANLWACSTSAHAEASQVTSGAVQCSIDLNSDGRLDTVVLVTNQKAYELVALLKKESSYQAFLVNTSDTLRNLTCVYGVSVEGTAAGPGQGPKKTYRTGGAYVKLEQPEGSVVVYFWNGAGFTEVWTAD